MLAKSLARLSSGSKITSRKTTRPVWPFSLRFDAQIKRTSAASANVATPSPSSNRRRFLKKIGDALNRMSELSISSQDVTKRTATGRSYDKSSRRLASYVTNTGGKDFTA